MKEPGQWFMDSFPGKMQTITSKTYDHSSHSEIQKTGAGKAPHTSIHHGITRFSIYPYFLACQYHPEFLSRPGKPHPLFKGLIKASQDKLTQSN